MYKQVFNRDGDLGHKMHKVKNAGVAINPVSTCKGANLDRYQALNHRPGKDMEVIDSIQGSKEVKTCGTLSLKDKAVLYIFTILLPASYLDERDTYYELSRYRFSS